MQATDFPIDGSGYYIDRNWLAVNPDKTGGGKHRVRFRFPTGRITSRCRP